MGSVMAFLYYCYGPHYGNGNSTYRGAVIPRIALDKPRDQKVDLKFLKWIMFLCIMSIAMKNNMQSHILLIYKVAVLCKIPKKRLDKDF